MPKSKRIAGTLSTLSTRLIMSAKAPPNQDPEEEEDYEEEDDDEEEDEADFVPGVDEEDEEEEVLPLMDGQLTLDEDSRVQYKGRGFNLTSVQPAGWNLLDSAVKPLEKSVTLEMHGTADVPISSGKPTPRKVSVTWSVQDRPDGAMAGKSSNDDDDAKAPSVYYQVSGRQMDVDSGDSLEFQGGYHPTRAPSSAGVSLVCQVRMISSKASSITAAKLPGAAAAPNVDEDDDDDEGDDDVDHDELIALHEDANMSVEALRKRYQSNGEEDTMGSAKKRAKPTDDDDDDYGF